MHISAGKKKDSILSQYKKRILSRDAILEQEFDERGDRISWYNYRRTDYAQQEQGLVLPRI